MKCVPWRLAAFIVRFPGLQFNYIYISKPPKALYSSSTEMQDKAVEAKEASEGGVRETGAGRVSPGLSAFACKSAYKIIIISFIQTGLYFIYQLLMTFLIILSHQCVCISEHIFTRASSRSRLAAQGFLVLTDPQRPYMFGVHTNLGLYQSDVFRLVFSAPLKEV